MHLPILFTALPSNRLILQIVVRPPIGWRKRYAPEIRRGRIKFERDVKSFRHLASDSRHFACHALFRAAMLENQPGIARKILAQHNQRTVIADAERNGLERYRLSLKSDVNAGTDAQQNSVAAATLLAANRLLHGRRSRLNERLLQRLHGLFHRHRHCFAFYRRA